MILSSLFCVASGGSLGPEAPLVQVTGSTGTWLGKIFRLKGEELRSLSIADGIRLYRIIRCSTWRKSFLFLEILHHKHAVEYYKAIIPALVASCFSYLMFALIIHLGIGATWDLKAYHYTGVYDFLYATLFGMVGTLFGWIFIFVVKFFKRFLNTENFQFTLKH
jgi:H+/Cl- antiporter ClcA